MVEVASQVALVLKEQSDNADCLRDVAVTWV